jgi:hypothetical protein
LPVSQRLSASSSTTTSPHCSMQEARL